ncbi:hypothetical protein [Thioalkalivibrio thiocyanodenitrificans]|uniref:hypothetical protein n=1 Tax=Thioalkalivibrio thiocyanodenitrificans TaxID=243063 RepID=UPI00036405A8|nr:hypothetical protein [Thioalkalivibrio thiocyanodenitrificans]
MSFAIIARTGAMPRLNRSLQAHGTAGFETTLKEEIVALGPQVLPLQQGLTSGSVGLGDRLGAMILRTSETPRTLHVRAGIFYTSIIAGCACADDPTFVGENTEYCEVDLEIDRETGEVRVSLAEG